MPHGYFGSIMVIAACLSLQQCASAWVTRLPGASVGFQAAGRQQSPAPRHHYTQPTPSRSLPRRPTKHKGHSLETCSASPQEKPRTRLAAATVSPPASTPKSFWGGKQSTAPRSGTSVSGTAPAAIAAPSIPAVVASGKTAERAGRNRLTNGGEAVHGVSASGLSPWASRLTLVLVACLYGTTYAAIKFVGESVDTSDFMALRFGLASLILLPSLKGVCSDVWKAGAEVGVYATLGYWAQAWAMRALPASQLALVGSLAVVLVPLYDHVSGRRRASGVTIAAALLACAGAALLQNAGGGDVAGCTDGTMWNDLLALSAPVFFGMTTWRMEAHVSNHPGQAAALTAGQVCVVGAASVAWSLLGGDWSSMIPEALLNPAANPWPLAVVLWTSLITTVVVLFMETTALESVTASEATVIYSLDPLVGVGIAASVLGEPFGPTTALGASLVLTSCLCSSLGHRDHQNEESP